MIDLSQVYCIPFDGRNLKTYGGVQVLEKSKESVFVWDVEKEEYYSLPLKDFKEDRGVFFPKKEK